MTDNPTTDDLNRKGFVEVKKGVFRRAAKNSLKTPLKAISDNSVPPEGLSVLTQNKRVSATNRPISQGKHGKTSQLEEGLYLWLESQPDIIHYVKEKDIPAIPLGHRCDYTPDAIAVRKLPNGMLQIEVYECKGYWMGHLYRGGIVKIKWAADKYRVSYTGYWADAIHTTLEFGWNYCEYIDYYLYKQNKEKQVWLIHIPPLGDKPKPKERV